MTLDIDPDRNYQQHQVQRFKGDEAYDIRAKTNRIKCIMNHLRRSKISELEHLGWKKFLEMSPTVL